MTFISRRSLLLSASLGLALAAQAQEVQKLPNMAVTGTAGTLSLQPSVVTAPVVTDSSIGLADAARYSAGFVVNDAGARGFGQTTTLRGLGNTPFFSDSSVPIYLDDIPLVSAFTFPTDLYDFSGVAIHRGPQAGAVFGRAGDAGVIQLTSAPIVPGFGGQVSFIAGNHGLLGGSASLQAASGAESDVSAGFSASQRDGYIRNTELNQDVDDRQSVAGRVRVRFRPKPDLELSFHVLGQRSRDGAQALVPLGSYYKVQRGKEGESDTDFGAAAFTVSRKIWDGTLSATSSYSKWELAPYDNRLVVFGGADFDSALTQSQRNFAEEVRFVSDRYTAGLFYSTGRTRGGADRVFSGFPVEKSSFVIDADTLAVYGRANLTLAPGWILSPGVRAERTAKDFTRTETIPGNQTFDRDNSWAAFLPSLSLTRRFDATTDLTLTVARGFKAGGYSAYTGQAALTKFDPETTWSAEAAFSTTPEGGKITYTARAYAYRVNDYQVERSFAVPNTGTDEYLVVNADRARVLGFEIESVWRPMRDVSVALAGSLSRATLENFTDPFTGVSYSGNQAPYAPTGNGSLRIDYRPETGLFAGAGVTWTGQTFYDEQETDMFSQHSYALIEAQVGFAFGRGDVRVFGRNLADKEYYTSITTGVGHATPGAPLTWGAQLDLHW